MPEYITDDVEVSSADSDRKYSSKKYLDAENLNEGN